MKRSDDEKLNANQTEISGALWALMAREGLSVFYVYITVSILSCDVVLSVQVACCVRRWLPDSKPIIVLRFLGQCLP